MPPGVDVQRSAAERSTSSRSSSPRRSRSTPRTSVTSSRWSTRSNTNCKPRGSGSCRGRLLLTRGTGTSCRWRTSSAAGCRFSSHPTQGCGRPRGPDGDKGLYTFMRLVLATDHGQAVYRRRMATVEPVFGQLKHNRGFQRFMRRGRSAVRSEWRLEAATHNLLKLHRHQIRRQRGLKAPGNG